MTEPVKIPYNKVDTATFGAGCFWCVEAVFRQFNESLDLRVGYTGGTLENPTYEQVCSGTTGHVEVIQIEYLSDKISYSQLLDIFWESHDPTTLNQQGADIGTQYKSAIFYHNLGQKRIAENSKALENRKSLYIDPIITEILPLTVFYLGEDYHQNYYQINPNVPYCQIVIKPKLNKLLKHIQ